MEEEQVVALAVKEGEYTRGQEKQERKAAQQEVKALGLAKGRDHIIQEVQPDCHSVTKTGFRIVTRSVTLNLSGNHLWCNIHKCILMFISDGLNIMNTWY